MRSWLRRSGRGYRSASSGIRRRMRDRERDIWLAWHIAALMRSRKLPALGTLLRPPKPKPMREELAERKQEFEELKARMMRRSG
jgi:hypothetical protein